MNIYIHQLKNWPRFKWKEENLLNLLAGVRNRQGRLLGFMQALGFPLQEEATLQMLTLDVLKSRDYYNMAQHTLLLSRKSFKNEPNN